MQLKHLLGAAIAASGALAADCSKNIKVESQGDLDDISSCKTYKGDITLQGDKLTTASINGVQKMEGSLIVKNATNLETLNAPDLEEIDDTFQINVAIKLSHMGFPKLQKVDKINWVTLPAMTQLSFDNKVTNATSIVISDTQLNSLEGINVQKVAEFNINNNRYLQEVDVDVVSVSDSLDISFNAQKVSAKFPSLQWANNITFRDVSEISMPNLTNVNKSLGFINNTVEEISVPKLKEVGGDLAIVSNSKLSNASFPQLTEISGGFQIANNTELESILGFPKVKTVGGAIDFVGDFDSAELKSLDLVKGGVVVDSDSDDFNCTAWDKAHKDGDIHGDKYVCKAKKHSTSVKLDGSAASGSSDESTATGSKSKGGAVPVSMEYAPLFGAAMAFIFQYI